MTGWAPVCCWVARHYGSAERKLKFWQNRKCDTLRNFCWQCCEETTVGPGKNRPLKNLSERDNRFHPNLHCCSLIPSSTHIRVGPVNWPFFTFICQKVCFRTPLTCWLDGYRPNQEKIATSVHRAHPKVYLAPNKCGLKVPTRQEKGDRVQNKPTFWLLAGSAVRK